MDFFFAILLYDIQWPNGKRKTVPNGHWLLFQTVVILMVHYNEGLVIRK